MQNVMNTLSSLTDFPEIENDIIHGDMPGDKIEINEELTQCKACENPVDKQKQRIDILDKMDALESEIEEMKHNLKENIRLSSNYDDDMVKLNNRVNDLRKQIIEIMQSK